MPFGRRNRRDHGGWEPFSAEPVTASVEVLDPPTLVLVEGWQRIVEHRAQIREYERALYDLFPKLRNIISMLWGKQVWLPLPARRVDPYAIPEARRSRIAMRSPRRASTGQTVWVGRPLTQRVFKLPDLLDELVSFDADGLHINGILSYDRVADVPLELIPQIRIFADSEPHRVYRIRLSDEDVANALRAHQIERSHATLTEQCQAEFSVLMSGLATSRIPVIFQKASDGKLIRGIVREKRYPFGWQIGDNRISSHSTGMLYYAPQPGD